MFACCMMLSGQQPFLVRTPSEGYACLFQTCESSLFVLRRRKVTRVWPEWHDPRDEKEVIQWRYLAARRWTRNSYVQYVIWSCAKQFSVSADIATATTALTMRRVRRVKEKETLKKNSRTSRFHRFISHYVLRALLYLNTKSGVAKSLVLRRN